MSQSGRLTVHVLDTANGCPAAAMRGSLFRMRDDGPDRLVKEFVTNAMGRCADPLLEGLNFTCGHYRLEFQVAEYFGKLGHRLPSPPFFDIVPIAFGIAEEDAHYHVPLLVSPFGYSTYRGS